MTAALQLFAEKGFEGTSLEQIAGQAKVNKALVSYHFGGKRGLQMAIHEEAFALIMPGLEALRRSTASAEDCVRDFITVFARLAEANEHYPVMILRLLIARDVEGMEAFAVRMLALQETLAGILERGGREAGFRSVDPLKLQISLLGSLLFFFASSPARSRMAASGKMPLTPPSSVEYIQHLQDFTVCALRS